MQYTIREGTESDLPRLFEFVLALAEIEDGRESVTNSVAQMEKERGSFEFLVVEVESEVVGAAVYCETYSTWAGKSLYVDDVYVREEFRGHGLGKALMRTVAQEAVQRGCHRLRWQVTAQNTVAQKIWEKIGAEIDREIHNCTFDEVGIRKLADAPGK